MRGSLGVAGPGRGALIGDPDSEGSCPPWPQPWRAGGRGRDPSAPSRTRIRRAAPTRMRRLGCPRHAGLRARLSAPAPAGPASESSPGSAARLPAARGASVRRVGSPGCNSATQSDSERLATTRSDSERLEGVGATRSNLQRLGATRSDSERLGAGSRSEGSAIGPPIWGESGRAPTGASSSAESHDPLLVTRPVTRRTLLPPGAPAKGEPR
jgi:hypothetical protein